LQELASLLGVKPEERIFDSGMEAFRVVCTLEELLPLLGREQILTLLFAPVKEVREFALKHMR